MEIISTGIPVGLSYNGRNITNFKYNGTSGRWIANEEQVQKYASAQNYEEIYEGMYGAAGLYYNFEMMKLKVKPASFDANYNNYGYYSNINGKTKEELTGQIFRSTESISSKIIGIRDVMLNDMDGKVNQTIDEMTGLFRLADLKNVSNGEKYGVSNFNYIEGGVFMANAYTATKNQTNYIRYISFELGGRWTYAEEAGLRPVISISGVELKQDTTTGVWQMK